MSDDRERICPVERANALDGFIRRKWQPPRKVLSPYVQEGMTVLDVGCGPGFFSVAMADMVGPDGKVIAADLQDGMLKKLGDKVRGTTLQDRIVLVKCATDTINVSEPVDFALAFFMVHEVPDKDRLFSELRAVVRPAGRVLLVEPKLFHVSRKQFDATKEIARSAGFDPGQGPRLSFSWSAVLTPV
jgi:ubiquinone/menaquinone biosynthesis C-methylase UbiE